MEADQIPTRRDKKRADEIQRRVDGGQVGDVQEGETSNAQRPTSNAELRGEKTLIGGFDFVGGDNEGDLGDGIVFAQEFAGGFDGDPGRLCDRITVGAAADRGEGDSADVVLDSSA